MHFSETKSYGREKATCAGASKIRAGHQRRRKYDLIRGDAGAASIVRRQRFQTTETERSEYGLLDYVMYVIDLDHVQFSIITN